MNDFIKSDYCQECGGSGVVFHLWEGCSSEYQCEECERLHGLEIKADIYSDLER